MRALYTEEQVKIMSLTTQEDETEEPEGRQESKSCGMADEYDEKY